jgi:hypothetical protein
LVTDRLWTLVAASAIVVGVVTVLGLADSQPGQIARALAALFAVAALLAVAIRRKRD